MAAVSFSPAADGPPLAFDVGAVRVAISPFRPGQLARFLLYRAGHMSSDLVLIGSGWGHDTAICIQRATSIVRRAGSLA